MTSLRTRSFAEMLTFTRSTTATYCNSAGVLVSAAANEPRVEYDPATHAVRGLLIEESRTNYLLRSQEFDNASWTKTRSSVTANLEPAPDGTLTADKLVEDSTPNESHYLLQTYTKGSSAETQSYAASVWAKSAGRSQLHLKCQGSSGTANSCNATFDLVSGEITAGPTTYGAWSNVAARIEAWPDGWYRCSLTFLVDNDAQAAIQVVCFAASNGATSYSGDGTSGLYLWGAQLEKGVHPTSYVATTTATVTRSADSCTMPVADAWFNEPEGTLFAEFLLLGENITSPVTYPRIAQLDDGSEVDRHLLYISTASGDRIATTTVNSAAEVSAGLGDYVPGVANRAAMAWRRNDSAAAATDASVVSDTDCEVPSGLTTLRLGRSSGSTSLNGYLRKLRVYPRRMTDAELAALVA
jgi:hypothetical protein